MPVEIKLNHGHATVVDEQDADLAALKWFTLSVNKNRYAKRGSQLLHRIVLSRALDRELVAGEQVDHIDGDGLNNCRSNIRLATGSQNCANRRPRSTHRGVTYHKSRRKWQAQIGVHGKNIYLGVYGTEEEAREVYKAAARIHFGEFARLED